MTDRKTVEELTLLLLYLTAWEEEVLTGKKALRSWKGYLFSILDELEEKDLIRGGKRAKSVYLTPEGEKTARELIKKYLEEG